MLKRVLLFRWTLLLAVLLLGGCQSEDVDTGPRYSDSSKVEGDKVYILGVHPLHNPSKLLSIYGPLADYLSTQLPGIQVQVEASKNYPAYDEKIEQEKFDFILPNPYQTLKALDNFYAVINQVGESDLFRGLILVRKDGEIKRVKDLTGKKIAYPAPTALAATMMPQLYLQNKGLDLKNTQTLYVGSQESSIMNVYLEHTSASATWTIPWLDLQQNQPEIADKLKVAWRTHQLPNNSFMYHRNKVPLEVALKVQASLANLHTHINGQALLKKMNVKQVFIAENQTYKPVMDFLRKFEETIGDNHKLPSEIQGKANK